MFIFLGNLSRSQYFLFYIRYTDFDQIFLRVRIFTLFPDFNFMIFFLYIEHNIRASCYRTKTQKVSFFKTTFDDFDHIIST